MRLLKWLFQPAYLLLIIVVVALYVNRDRVFPEEVAESLEVEALAARAERLVERMRSSDSEQVAGESAKGEAPAEVAAPSEEQTAFAPPEAQAEGEAAAPLDEMPQAETVAALDDAATAQETLQAELAASDESQELPQAPQVSEAELQEPSSSPVVEQPAPEPLPAPPQLATSDSQPVAPQAAAEEAIPPLELWKSARAAVWQGDLEAAVASYQKLISVQPGNYDAYGEMGNVLLAQSRVQAAADAYATAATLIYRSGNRQMAYRVATIVAQLDRPRGQALQAEFAQQ